MLMHRILTAAALAVAISTGSMAQGTPPATVQTPLQDLRTDNSLGDQLQSVWSSIRRRFSLFGSSGDYARSSRRADHTDDFNWLMGIAGFKLKSIDSTISLLPGLSLEFGQARELSEADREYLERALERHARRHPGPISAMQRLIVEGILEANELEGYGVEKLTVTLLPIPYVKISMAPVDPPLGLEASYILRAIERLNQRLRQTQTTTPGFMPETPTPPSVRPASVSH